jgi:hypothetical protein
VERVNVRALEDLMKRAACRRATKMNLKKAKVPHSSF